VLCVHYRGTCHCQQYTYINGNGAAIQLHAKQVGGGGRSHTSLAGVNEFLPVLATFIVRSGAIRYKRCAPNTVEGWWDQWKSAQGRTLLMGVNNITLRRVPRSLVTSWKARNALVKPASYATEDIFGNFLGVFAKLRKATIISWLSLCLSVCFCLSLCLCLSVCLSVCLCLPACLPACLSVRPYGTTIYAGMWQNGVMVRHPISDRDTDPVIRTKALFREPKSPQALQ
jgi:hypothetical protein